MTNCDSQYGMQCYNYVSPPKVGFSSWLYVPIPLIVQGTAKAQCTLYLWNYCDKIVISDIDGTITR